MNFTASIPFSSNFFEVCLVEVCSSHQHCLSSVNLCLPTNIRTVTEAAFKKIFVLVSRQYLFQFQANICSPTNTSTVTLTEAAFKHILPHFYGYETQLTLCIVILMSAYFGLSFSKHFWVK